MKTTFKFVMFPLFLLSISTCDSDKPTRETAIATLRTLNEAFQAGNWDEAERHLKMPPGEITLDQDQLEKVKGEISAKGIDQLEKSGTWGKLTTVFGEGDRGLIMAAEFGLDTAYSYALVFDNAEACFYWDDGHFLVFRCDDISKLEHR